MKEEYKWNYTIKIKTKDNEYVYEKENLSDIDLLLMKYPNYEEVRAEQNKPKTLEKRRSNAKTIRQKNR